MSHNLWGGGEKKPQQTNMTAYIPFIYMRNDLSISFHNGRDVFSLPALIYIWIKYSTLGY